MDTGIIIKSVVGMVVILTIITVVAIPIIGGMLSSTETRMVEGDGVTIDVMSSDVSFTLSRSEITIDGQDYQTVGRIDSDSDFPYNNILAISDTFAIFNQSQGVGGYYGSTSFGPQDDTKFTIEDGKLMSDGEVLATSTWCYAVVNGDIGEYAVLYGKPRGEHIGPVEYGGGEAIFATFGGSGIRYTSVSTIDGNGSIDRLYGNDRGRITVSVTPQDGYSTIEVDYDTNGSGGYLLLPQEYTVTTTNDDATFEMIGLVPIIMVAGAVIATIGLFMRSRS